MWWAGSASSHGPGSTFSFLRSTCSVARAEERRFAAESSAPFGVPVDPEVVATRVPASTGSPARITFFSSSLAPASGESAAGTGRIELRPSSTWESMPRAALRFVAETLKASSVAMPVPSSIFAG